MSDDPVQNRPQSDRPTEVMGWIGFEFGPAQTPVRMVGAPSAHHADGDPPEGWFVLDDICNMVGDKRVHVQVPGLSCVVNLDGFATVVVTLRGVAQYLRAIRAENGAAASLLRWTIDVLMGAVHDTSPTCNGEMIPWQFPCTFGPAMVELDREFAAREFESSYDLTEDGEAAEE